MRQRLSFAGIALGTIVMLAVGTPRAQTSPAVELRTAIELEKVAGDTQKAVEIYKRLTGSSDATVARSAREALVRLDALQTEAANAFPERTPAAKLRPAVNISPNGKLAVTAQGPGRLALIDMARSVERTVDLGPGRSTIGPVIWSPDSRSIAVSVLAPTGAPVGEGQLGLGELRVIAAETLKSQVVCTSGRAQVWSPDSKQLALYAGTSPDAGEVRVVTLGSDASRTMGKSRQVPNYGFGAAGDPGSVAWAPDGRRLAFRVFTETGTEEIRIGIVSTGESRVLAVPGLTQGGRAKIVENIENVRTGWTTKDDIVIRMTDPAQPGSKIVLVPVAGGRPRIVCVARPDQEACRGLTPDGAFSIVAKVSDHRYYLRNTSTGDDRPMTLSSGEEWWAQVSPDGKLMTLISNREGGGKWGLYVIPVGVDPVAAPTRLMSLEALPTRVTKYQWTNDGSFLATFAFNTSQIYRVRMNPSTGRSAGALERLTHDAPENDAPQVSPDGTQIAYRQPSYTGVKISVMNVSGIGERPVRSATGQALMAFGELMWKNPTELIFDTVTTRTAANRREWAPPALATLNVSTGTVTPLPNSDIAGEYVRWQYSRARNEILRVRQAPGGPAQLVARSLGDGTERVVVSVSDGTILSFLVSADGRRIAFQYGPRTGASACPCELRIASLDGAPVKTLLAQTPLLSLAGWSGNARFLLYAQGTGAPRVIDVDSGENWPLLEGDRQPSLNGTVGWAPDGSFLVLSAAESREDSHAWDGITHDAVIKRLQTRRR